MSHDSKPTPRDEFETIAPAEVRLASTPGADADAGSDAPFRAAARPGPPRGALIGILALALIAIVVFALLPQRTPQPPTPSPSTPQSVDRAGPDQVASAATDRGGAGDELVVPPFEQLRLQRERAAAQEVLERVLTLSEELEGRAVERWGAERHAQARALAEAGDALFLARDYEVAQQRYRDALAALEALRGDVDGVIAQQLERGRAALLEGDAAAALEAFAFAAAVDPGNADAAAGRARAEVLDEVLGLLQDARDIARDGALTAARGLIDEALALDPANPRAREARREVDEQLRAAAFTRAMSDGYGALRAGRFAAARAEFERARTLRGAGGDAEEVDQALRIADAEALGARIDAVRREAERAAAEEQWAQAAEHYAAALELDGTLAFARDGVALARRRAALDDAIVAILDGAERLGDDAELEAAQGLLVRARGEAPAGPRLTRQIETLAETLRVAAIPVPVEFVSDGATRVTLLRVARLGTFESRTLELRPGAYVATGNRNGYRDVRVEFLVTGNGTEAPVAIRCETRI